MPVYIQSTSYESTLDGTSINWLLANVGDEVTITHLVSVKEFQINSNSNPWIMNNKDGYLGTVWITGGDFSKFNVGDTIKVYNYYTNTGIATTFTIVEKLSNTEIRLSPNGPWAANQTGTQDVFSKVKLVTSMLYKWNFIENGEQLNFFSKIDGNEQVATRGGLNAASGNTYPMIMNGPASYQIGDITIEEVGISTIPVYESTFRIVHKTRITPIMLAAQWDDLLNGISPDYFTNLNCLRPVFYFEARYNLTDPNEILTGQEDTVQGNTGWFNQNWNLPGTTNYSRSGLMYEDSTGMGLSSVALQVGSYTKFQFDIDNTVDTPFVAGSTKVELSFVKAPNDQSEYQNNGRDVRHNFVWETATLTVQSGTPSPVNGDNYGDPTLQSLETLRATFISSSKIRITGRISILQDAFDVFNESAEPRYLMFASVQNHSVLGAMADRVTILVDSGSVFFQTQFPGLVDFYDTLLLPHTNADYTDPIAAGDVFTEDELVGYSRFEIVEDVNHPTTTKTITSVRGKVVAVNTATQEEFNLESYSVNVQNAPVYNGNQVFNITQAKPIHVPSAEIRKPVRAYFDATSGIYYFAYPYLNRWEYWVALNSANQYFFSQAQPNNGLNHDWRRYSDLNDWKLEYRTEVAMKVNGVPAIYRNGIQYNDFDRNLVGAETTCTIQTFNTLGTQLISGATKYILGYDYTLVKATFVNMTSSFTLSDCVVVIGIEVFEEGGVNGKRRMSSKYVSDSDTWFIPIPGETKTKLSLTNVNTLVAETWIDFNQINLNKSKYKLTARLYGNDKVAGAPNPARTFYSQNYLGDQVVYLIRNNPIPSTPQVLPPADADCEGDFVWRVLADAGSSDPLKNDTNSFLWWFDADAVDTAEISLVKKDGTTINLTGNTTLGTPFDYGFYTNGQNEKLVGYLLNWKAVMAAYGECIYQVKVEAQTIFGDVQTRISDKYCLKQYTQPRADGTVRVEYYLNGILGMNEFDDRSMDLGTLNWYNQHRFDGIFIPGTSQYTTDEIQYETGLRVTVEDEQEPEFTLKLKPMAAFKHNVFRTDIMQADQIMVTDYNTKNVDVFYKKQVRKNGEYAPEWKIGKSKIAAVNVKFKQAINNLRKFIS